MAARAACAEHRTSAAGVDHSRAGDMAASARLLRMGCYDSGRRAAGGEHLLFGDGLAVSAVRRHADADPQRRVDSAPTGASLEPRSDVFVAGAGLVAVAGG